MTSFLIGKGKTIKRVLAEMSLDKEQAHRLADQIMEDAKQESIARLNKKKVRISLIYRHTKLMKLQSYQQADVLRKAREKALEHPLIQKAWYFYSFFGFHFFIYVVKTSHLTSIFDIYLTMLLSSFLTVFELWRAYLVYKYVKEILIQYPNFNE